MRLKGPPDGSTRVQNEAILVLGTSSPSSIRASAKEKKETERFSPSLLKKLDFAPLFIYR